MKTFLVDKFITLSAEKKTGEILLFEKLNKIDKPLYKLTKRQRENSQNNRIQ